MAVKLTGLQLIYGVAGAREKFEDLCVQLLLAEQPNLKRMRVVVGDGGIDAYEGELKGTGGIDVFQTKFFPAGIGESQKKQIRDSFKSVSEATDFTVNNWTLCLPIDLGVEETKWFESWSGKQHDSGIAIAAPYGALKIESLLCEERNRGIKEAFFKEEYLAQIRDMSEILPELLREFRQRMPDPSVGEQLKQERSTALAQFVTEAQQLRGRLNEKPLPIADHNKWVDRTSEYLRDHLGAAYAVRFNDFSGMTFFGDASEKSQMSRSLNGRTQRLFEFIREL